MKKVESLYDGSTDVKVLTYGNFHNRVTDTADLYFIEFYATWYDYVPCLVLIALKEREVIPSCCNV